MHAGVFCFTLGNIPPVNRSSLKAIYLLAVVKSKVIDEYGFHSVLKKLLLILITLRIVWLIYIVQTSGIEVAVSGRNIVRKGGMQLFLADTVGFYLL